MKPERPLSDLKRKAREIVVKTLYEMEMGGLEVPEARARVQKKCQRSEVRQFALRLFDITLEHFSELDSIIVKVAENWDLNRMAVVDRNVLRLSRDPVPGRRARQCDDKRGHRDSQEVLDREFW
jgi:transcription termination factor NusB